MNPHQLQLLTRELLCFFSEEDFHKKDVVTFEQELIKSYSKIGGCQE